MTHYSRWCIYIHCNALVHVIVSYQFRVPQCENGQSRFTALAPLLHCTVGYGTTRGCSNWDLLQKICAKTRSNGHWHRRPNLEIQTSYFPADFLTSEWLGHEQSCKSSLKFLFWFLFRFIFQIWLYIKILHFRYTMLRCANRRNHLRCCWPKASHRIELTPIPWRLWCMRASPTDQKISRGPWDEIWNSSTEFFRR